MKRAFFVFSMLSLSGATTLAQNIYVHVEQEGKRLEQLGTAEFEVNADSHPCVEFVNGKAVMTINGNRVAALRMSSDGTKVCQNSLILKNHKALTFTSQGFAMSKSCCTFRP